MYKILIISNSQIETIAGTEKYNRNLVNLLVSMNFQIDEYAFLKKDKFTFAKFSKRFYGMTNENYLKKNWYFRNFGYRKRIENDVNKIIKTNNYDIVINSTNVAIKSIMWDDNYFWVQHFDPYFIQYSNLRKNFSDLCKSIIFRILLKLNNLKTCLTNSKNIVCFYDGFIPNKFLRDNINYFFVPITSENQLSWSEFNQIDFASKKKKNILYLGRIEQRQKNLLFLHNNFNNVDYYGPVKDKYICNILGDSYKGIWNNEENLKELILNHSYVILSSNFEGFPTVFIESLSYATPIISSNQIRANNFFFHPDKKIGYEIDIKNFDKNFINSLNNISSEEYKKMCFNALTFSRGKLSSTYFTDGWRKIIEDNIKESERKNIK